MLVVAIGGSPSRRSRSGILLDHARQWLQAQGVEVVTFQVLDFAAEDLLHARFDSPRVKHFQEMVAAADGVIVATPVYKASFSGALKTLLDLLPERALEHRVVLPIATGGSIAHMLAVDYALKPVLSALKAQETLHGIFAGDRQISYPQDATPAQLDEALQARLLDSLNTFHQALARRPRPLPPGLLDQRLRDARWSI